MAALVFTGLVFLAALSGAFFKPGAWYESLRKPAWTPPNWAFPVVWTILYIMIAAAGWLVWRSEGVGPATVFWGVQLALNASWSYLFFQLRRMDLAFACVGTLFLAILCFIASAWPVEPVAALLFVPYGMWVLTAASLNWQVWSLNPAAVGGS